MPYSIYPVLAKVSLGYPSHRGRFPTCYSPVRHSMYKYIAYDLHVLGMPPAFILSQDQTLNKLYLKQHLCRIKIDLLKFNLFQNKSQNRILFYTRFNPSFKRALLFLVLKSFVSFSYIV